MKRFFIPLLAAPLILVACASTPEPIQEKPVVVDVQPVNTCRAISELQRVVIPAKTKTVTSVSVIENPPYEPIEREETHTVEISPAIVYYVDSTGAQVTDICEEQT